MTDYSPIFWALGYLGAGAVVVVLLDVFYMAIESWLAASMLCVGWPLSLLLWGFFYLEDNPQIWVRGRLKEILAYIRWRRPKDILKSFGVDLNPHKTEEKK
jgi:hypothetical protein